MSTANLVAVVSVVVLLALLVAAAAALATPKLRKRHVPGRLAGVGFVVLYPIALGFGFASQTTRGPGGVSLGNAVYVFGLFALLPLAVLVISPRFRPWLTALVLAYGFAMLLEIFSLVYWDHGTSRNFSTPLSHLDAFYFALGTLTTGTGNISAISETSRRIQTAQMVIDLVFIGFIVALVMARYSTLLERSHRELPRDAAGTRDQYAALLPLQERVLGPEHPDTLTTRASLALWTGKAGNPAEARDQYTALLPIRERVLGAEHPATLVTRHNLATWTGEAGNAAGARDQLADLLPTVERVLGGEHPDTLTARREFAYWTGKAGKPAEARDQYATLLPTAERVLGPEHPDTLITRREFAYWAEKSKGRGSAPN